LVQTGIHLFDVEERSIVVSRGVAVRSSLLVTICMKLMP